MNNAKDTSTSQVIDLTRRQDPRTERVGDLLGAVRRIASNRLQALADSMFDNVDDALFDLAEKAENNAVQTQFFDGMREVRKKRALIERLFLEQTARNLADFAAGRLEAPRPAAAGMPHTGELSLVEDTELEESLAITSMVSKTESRLARQLFAVNQRLSVICGGNKLDNATNPIGPALLGQSFRSALGELSVELRVRLIVFKLFDRYVMAGLDALYAEINNELMRAGVLPQLRHSVPGRHAGSTAAPAAPQQAAAGETAAESGSHVLDEDGRAAIRDEVLHTLQNLLAARRRPATGSGGMARGSMRGDAGSGTSEAALSPAELLSALSLLQSEAAHRPELAADTEMDLTGIDAEQVKQALLARIGRLRGAKRSRMAGADEDTIDLVAMLFEFILQDRNLPAEMQAMLARLQIPYLKAAILDRRMFSHPQHPARRLLDGLAELAKGWSEESDRDHRIYDKVRSVVTTLLQDFEDDIELFTRLDQDLHAFIENNARRAHLAEQRVAEATRGREKLQQARRRAAQEILSRIDQRDLPSLAHGILTRAWANYLVLTLLRHGDESPEFRAALRFVDDFIWSTQPMRGEADVDRLRQLLPLLEKALRNGLATVAFQDADVENLIGQLHGFYARQLGEAPAEAPEPDASAVAAIPDSVEVIATPELAGEDEDVPAPDAAKVDDEALQRVRALKVGTWVEFAGDDASGGPQRAKLSWISPISGKYLFVNRRGLKVADKSQQQLAAELADGGTVVLEELPLFDRALDAIVERLRKTQPAVPPAEGT